MLRSSGTLIIVAVDQCSVPPAADPSEFDSVLLAKRHPSARGSLVPCAPVADPEDSFDSVLLAKHVGEACVQKGVTAPRWCRVLRSSGPLAPRIADAVCSVPPAADRLGAAREARR